MAVSFGSNVQALSLIRRLDQSSARLRHSIETLGSGLRINRASDDSAGLAISSALRADSRIYSQAIRNLNDGISALSIAESAASTVQAQLLRLRELAAQSSNGTISSQQRVALQKEADGLTSECNRILATTNFNGRALLNDAAEELILTASPGEAGLVGIDAAEALKRLVPAGTFLAPATNTIANTPFDITTGDFNNDGMLDTVRGVGGNSTIVELGNGDGTFWVKNVLRSAGTTQRAVAVADFDNNGTLDIVEGGNTAALYVFLGNGDGNFRATATYTLSDTIEDLLTTDLNSDGHADVIASLTAGGIAVLISNSDGTFNAATPVAVGTTIYSLAAGDFNADGKIDVLGAGSGGLFAMWGNGTGTLSPVNLGYGGSGRIAAADFDLDGDTDAVFTNQGSPSILVSNGNGTFKGATTIYTGGVAANLAVDLNADGYADLVTPQLYFLGNGNGTFGDPVTFGAAAGFIAAGDFNGDGAQDIVGLNSSNMTRIFSAGGLREVTSVPRIEISSAQSARSALETVEQAAQRVRVALGTIGTGINRLSVSLSNLAAQQSGCEEANSRLADADVAFEQAALIRESILQQSAAALLAQVNTQPEIALKLLRG